MSENGEPGWLAEPPLGGFQQRARIIARVFEGRSPFQQIGVYDTVPFGRVLTLDGAVQTTTHDEFVYHEMLVHPALLAHPKPSSVLTIGGGDGGTLRRVLEHGVRRALMVEIDREVVEVCRAHLPEIAGDALDDPRGELRIADGVRLAAETPERFDVVLVDSTDPVGPAVALFGSGFYHDVARMLGPDGLLVTQSGSPLLMPAELAQAAHNLRAVFPFVRCCLASIPSYPGCLWSFLVAGNNPAMASFFEADAPGATRDLLARNCAKAGLKTRYYTPEVHFASFALPPFLAANLAT